MEIYGNRSSGSKHISSRQIREMKKNMQKVPRIQQKSDEYHLQEEVSAEKILDQVTEESPYTFQQEEIEEQIKSNRFQNILKKLHFIFTK